MITEYIDRLHALTDGYLSHVGGALTSENMNQLNTNQHSLLAFRYLVDEVMEGGYLQLIANGFAPYVLEGPFPFWVKKEWGRKDFSKHLYEVKKEYHINGEVLLSDLTDEEFMALYEQLEHLNDLGDDFLDEFLETELPAILTFVNEHEQDF